MSGGHIEVNADALHWLGGFEAEANFSDSQSSASPTNAQTNNNQSDAKSKPTKSSKPSNKAKPSKPIVKQKKVLSYAERFALEHGVIEEKVTALNEPQNDTSNNQYSLNHSYSQNPEPEPDADILVIASEPSTPQYDYEDDLNQSFNRAMPVYDQSYDEDYTDYKNEDYPMDDQFCINSQQSGYYQPQSSSPPQPQNTFKRYTLNDYKHLPKEVKLGTLGSSADPAKLAETREKQRAAKALADKIRLSNLKRAQLSNQSDEKRSKEQAESQPKPKSKREIAAEFAKNVPKPRVSASNSTSNQPTNNHSLKDPSSDDRDDEIQAMIRQQQAHRIHVSKIKASLGLSN